MPCILYDKIYTSYCIFAGLQGVFNLLFGQCVQMLQSDENNIRNINALQTLCALTTAVLRKKFTESNFDMVDTLIGFESAECQMQVIECNYNNSDWC